MKYWIKWSLFLTFIWSHTLFSETVSLQKFIQQSLQRHPHAKTNYLTYIQKVHSLKGNDGIKDWTLFMESAYQKGLGSNGVTQYSDDGSHYRSQLAVNKVIHQTGTRFSTGYSYSALKNPVTFPDFGSIPDFYEAKLQVQIIQPLLKNMWGQLDRYPLQLKDLELELAQIKYHTDINTYISQLTTVYLEWAQHYQELSVLKVQYQKAKKQVNLLEIYVKRGVSELTDLVLAKQNLLSKKMSFDLAKTTYQSTRRRISFFYYGKANPDRRLIPRDTSILPKPKNNIWPYVKSESLLAKSFRLEEKLHSLAITAQKNKRLPDLNLSLGHTRRTLSTTQSELYDDNFDKKETTIALQLTHPIGNQKEKSTLKALETKQKKTKLIHANKWIQVKQIIDDIQSQIKLTETQLKDTNELLRLSKKAAHLEKEKFSQGRSPSLTFVLAAEDAVLSTKIQKIQLTIKRQQLFNQQYALINRYSRQFIDTQGTK